VTVHTPEIITHLVIGHTRYTDLALRTCDGEY